MIEQRTDEWHALRCGKITASRIADIMRSGRGGKPSASRARYMGELITERLTGQPTPSFKSNDMQWGNDTEAEAADAYAFLHGHELETVAFVQHPLISTSGASPDRLVGSDGLVEIKCPASHTHIETLLGAEVANNYILQMQWQMDCTGRKWCDFVSYDPRMPVHMRMYVDRYMRDDTLIAEIRKAVTVFEAELSETIGRLAARYPSEDLQSVEAAE
jgi:putative phage-type endonuclease